jgi:hypothetical protein
LAFQSNDRNALDFHRAVDDVVEGSVDKIGMTQLIECPGGGHVHVVQIHFLRDQGISFDRFQNVAMQFFLFHGDALRLKAFARVNKMKPARFAEVDLISFQLSQALRQCYTFRSVPDALTRAEEVSEMIPRLDNFPQPIYG